MLKRYEFPVVLVGEGKTIQEAWEDALEWFSLNPEMCDESEAVLIGDEYGECDMGEEIESMLI